MTLLSSGINRTLRGLRTGDRKALLGGLAMLVFGLWRSRRNRPSKVISKTTVKPGETLVIRGTRFGEMGRDPSPPPPVQTL